MLLSFQVIAGVLGGMLLCYVLFSYESEEMQIKSWLEEAWIALDDKDKKATQRVKAFIDRLLNGVLSVFRRIYGKRIFSLRGWVGAFAFYTLVYVVGEMMMADTLKGAEVMFAVPHPLGFQRMQLPWVALAIFQLTCKNDRVVIGIGTLWMSFCIAAATCPIFGGVGTFGCKSYFLPSLIPDGTGFVMAFLEMISAMILTWLLALAVKARRLTTTLALVMAALMETPIFYFALSWKVSYVWLYFRINFLDASQGIYGLIFWAYVIIFGLLGVVISGVLGRFIYAALPRVVNALLKHKILENRKASVTIAVLLLGVAMPKTADIIEKLAKGIVG